MSRSMLAEVPDSCAGAAQEPMEDDAEDREAEASVGLGGVSREDQEAEERQQ